MNNRTQENARALTGVSQPFPAEEPGFLLIDVTHLPPMPDGAGRRYLFAAVDCATRYVYADVAHSNSPAAARDFLKSLDESCPMRIRRIRTDLGVEFSARPFGGLERATSREHVFARLCAELGIERVQTPLMTPQTMGIVERFIGGISKAIKTQAPRSDEEVKLVVEHYVELYNQDLPQRAFGGETPGQAINRWRTSHPEYFVKRGS